MIEALRDYEARGLVRSQTHPTADLIIWNYADKVQYEPELWDEITLMCRGLITNSRGEIIERPFEKFFNHGERQDQPTDIEKAKIFEKLDGSLGIMYWLGDTPHIATRGSFTSEQAIRGTDMLHRMNRSELDEIRKLGNASTHLYEIIYPENRIVVDYHGSEGLVYLCSIHKHGGETVFFNDMPFPSARRYTYAQFTDLMKSEISGNEMEGFVALHQCGTRIKYKLEDYKRLHYYRTQMNDLTIWQWVRDGKNIDELLKDVPDELYSKIRKYISNLNCCVGTLGSLLCRIKEEVEQLETRKEQALKLFEVIDERGLDRKLCGVVFAMLDGKDCVGILLDQFRPSGGDASFLHL